MTENKRFKVDYNITVGNYCLHDECKAKGVDGYIAYLSDEERANNLCDLLNALHEKKSYPICFVCEHCFRDDWYGVCCNNKNSEHYTRSWDLDLQTKCEHFKLNEWLEY